MENVNKLGNDCMTTILSDSKSQSYSFSQRKSTKDHFDSSEKQVPEDTQQSSKSIFQVFLNAWILSFFGLCVIVFNSLKRIFFQPRNSPSPYTTSSIHEKPIVSKSSSSSYPIERTSSSSSNVSELSLLRNRMETVTSVEKAEKMLKLSQNYEEWAIIAERIDILQGRQPWKEQMDSLTFDSKLIVQRMNSFSRLALAGDIHGLAHELRAGMVRKLGGIGNPKLFQYCMVGTKRLIEQYTEEVALQLQFICDTDFGDNFPLDKKFDFFYSARQSFGRSALLLSGGATMAMYHLGVIKALWENQLLPRVISGSSAGSIIAALACVRTDDELHQLFHFAGWNLSAFEKLEEGSSLRRKLLRLFKKGVLLDIRVLQACVRENLGGDITFKEAFDRTNRILNITVTSTDKFEFPRLLNYITAPNVLIWSAACASSALPFLFEPVDLMAKDKSGNIIPYTPSGHKWMDGSVGADLPMSRLSELFNVNHFIVSQVNPHVAPFLLSTETRKGGGFISGLMYLLKSELKHRVTQLAELGLLPSIFHSIQPIVTQQYHGDITIVPEISFRDYKNLFSNPDQQFVEECIAKGRQSTWPKISQIKGQCRIEFTLERCFEKLRQQLPNQEDSLRSHLSFQPRNLNSSSTISSDTSSNPILPNSSLVREREANNGVKKRTVDMGENHEDRMIVTDTSLEDHYEQENDIYV